MEQVHAGQACLAWQRSGGQLLRYWQGKIKVDECLAEQSPNMALCSSAKIPHFLQGLGLDMESRRGRVPDWIRVGAESMSTL